VKKLAFLQERAIGGGADALGGLVIGAQVVLHGLGDGHRPMKQHRRQRFDDARYLGSVSLPGRGAQL